ncbi:unnamed protein product [Ambrosiozyma monospora]|uniref:Unnamed protein product n=1 Tax=Ambrosiozyma monospora TaxID=43982 RepID=A0A9W6YRT5_AMBMO|nr:unnamed protein product [Ambrosiozyma monospora]
MMNSRLPKSSFSFDNPTNSRSKFHSQSTQGSGRFFLDPLENTIEEEDPDNNPDDPSIITEKQQSLNFTSNRSAREYDNSINFNHSKTDTLYSHEGSPNTRRSDNPFVPSKSDDYSVHDEMNGANQSQNQNTVFGWTKASSPQQNRSTGLGNSPERKPWFYSKWWVERKEFIIGYRKWFSTWKSFLQEITLFSN